VTGDAFKPTPHSRAWLEAMGADYGHPWNQVLLEVSGESLFYAMLERLLTNDSVVLEAGCAGGRDAQRFASRVWVRYDFVPRFLETAGAKGVSQTSFVEWNSSKEPVPTAILGGCAF
jgi:hypothetical protein